MKTLITILALFTAVAVYTDAKAVQWQEKPVVCMVKEVLDAGLKLWRIGDGSILM